MADFEEASVSAFQHFFQDAGVVAATRLVWTLDYGRDVTTVVHCLLNLPLPPVSDKPDAVSEVREQVNAGSARANGLQQLIAYVLRHWICKRSIGPERPSVLRVLMMSWKVTIPSRIDGRIKVSLK